MSKALGKRRFAWDSASESAPSASSDASDGSPVEAADWESRATLEIHTQALKSKEIEGKSKVSNGFRATFASG